MKNNTSFLSSQINQIRAGGLHIFFKKVKKAGVLLFMSVAAPVAIHFNADWPQAYDFMIQRSLKRIKRLRLQSSPDKTAMDKLMEQLFSYLKSYTSRDPDLSNFEQWMQKCILLGNLYLVNNDMNECVAVHKRAAQIQQQMVQEHKWDDLGIEFIPRAIPSGSIGVYENLDAYIKAGILRLRPNKKMILLLDPQAPISNPCYLKYWNNYLTIISDPQMIKTLSPLEAYLTSPLVTFMHLRGKFYKSPLALGSVREQWIRQERPALLTLTREDQERGSNCLQSLGMPRDAWFVTLHVREPGWCDSGSREENFRNADISTYFPAIKAVTDAGGWVIRIGDPGMSKLPAMAQVIDYAHSSVKSDWMDIFLCSQCRFMIGTASGMCVVALTFGVPLVMTNLLPANAIYYFTSKDLFIPRLCYSKEKERNLNFSDLISPPVATATSQSHFDQLNVQVIENKAEEIKDLVEEMLEKCSGTLKYSEEDENLQNRFRDLASGCGNLHGDPNLVVNARIGRKFLRDHAQLLSADVMEESYLKG